MSVQLAFGIMTGPGMRCWMATPGGYPCLSTTGRAHPPGAPGVVGPVDAASGAVRNAVGRLSLLVVGGAPRWQRAPVSTSVAGSPPRDSRVTGATRCSRSCGSSARTGRTGWGDRAAILVGLFGLSATTRVGAAAHTAMVEERWAALQLASAVSDLLGPEQLEQVLALTAPDGTDPFPHGAASTLSGHLALVLARYPQPQRIT